MPAKKKQKGPGKAVVGPSTVLPNNVVDIQDTHPFNSFSSDASLFATISNGPNGHHLRVYSSSSSKIQSDYHIEGTCSCLRWGVISGDLGQPTENAKEPSKKRARRSSSGKKESKAQDGQAVIAIGTTKGTILLYSPQLGALVRRFSSNASNSALSDIVFADDSLTKVGSVLLSIGVDGYLRKWDVDSGQGTSSIAIPGDIPSVRMTNIAATVADGTDEALDLVLAHYAPRHFAIDFEDPAEPDLELIEEWSGHAATIQCLTGYRSGEAEEITIISASQEETYASLWKEDATGSSGGPTLPSIRFDTDDVVDQITLMQQGDAERLAIVTKKGGIHIYEGPLGAACSTPKKRKNTQAVRKADCTIEMRYEDGRAIQLAGAKFRSHNEIVIAWFVNAVRPVCEVITLAEPGSETYSKSVILKRRDDAGAFLDEDQSASSTGFPNSRYNDAAASLWSGLEQGIAVEAMIAADGLEVDMGDVDVAEQSLGERLKNRDMQENGLPNMSVSTSEAKAKDALPARINVPAASLSQVLTQALHSSDETLLTSCLVHTNLEIVRNTVARVPSVLIPKLIEALLQRFVGGKGKLGSSTQKTSGVVLWINQVLLIHSGYLMTMPDLKRRLSVLHSAIEHRLVDYDRLRALRGRIDLIVSQIELQNQGRAVGARSDGRASSHPTSTTKQYVEGESSSDEDDDSDAGTDEEGNDVEITPVERADESGANIDDITMMMDAGPDNEEVRNHAPTLGAGIYGNGITSYSDDDEDDDKLLSNDESDSEVEQGDDVDIDDDDDDEDDDEDEEDD